MMDPSIDIDLLVEQLRSYDFKVTSVISTPATAGTYELIINDEMYTLDGARALLEEAQAEHSSRATASRV